MQHPLRPALLAGLVLLASGCEKAADAAAEAAIERATGKQMEVDRDGSRLHVRAGDETLAIAAGAGVALPADFPGDVFLPASYGINSVMDVGGARLVNLESQGSLTAMFEAARADMERKGWSRTLAMQQADSAMLGFSDGTREATYTFASRTGGQLLVGIQLRDSAALQ
ncbi:hypothetical protein WCE41_08800 [Luteimonas sp. MJ246]|uniref:hypothetical protein n=1 Tax=Luteimonas sp. MJ174 TaxID=3129237 RepID=UPI0031BAB097